jgi:5-dehydro-2-deoxygluconokinase
MEKLGYHKPLYILPFDHRRTFAQNMFGLKRVEDLNFEQRELIKEFKMLIYKGFKKAVETGIPTDLAAVLCDEEFGSEILLDAKHNGFVTILTIEKSGEETFKFQYDNYQQHIERFKPTFTKVLIKFNPEDSIVSKKAQIENLKKISDYSHKAGFKFLLEVLVIANIKQLHEAKGSRDIYDTKLRPNLTIKAIREIQEAGIEPDIWKLEGFDSPKDYKNIVLQVKSGGRDNVNLVILGRGAEEEKVDRWLKIGAKVEGVVGFAVGRTVFWEALEKFHRGEISKKEVIDKIASNFLHFYNIFTSSF